MLKSKSVDQYIKLAPKQSQAKLKEMRKLIRSIVPDAVEGIKWGMPAYSYKRILVIFGGFSQHIGFYPTTSAMQAFFKTLSAKYVIGKGSIQFPLDKPLPVTLIKKIVKMRVKESKEEDRKWRS